MQIFKFLKHEVRYLGTKNYNHLTMNSGQLRIKYRETHDISCDFSVKLLAKSL